MYTRAKEMAASTRDGPKRASADKVVQRMFLDRKAAKENVFKIKAQK